jgi:hypothetical protein
MTPDVRTRTRNGMRREQGSIECNIVKYNHLNIASYVKKIRVY